MVSSDRRPWAEASTDSVGDDVIELGAAADRTGYLPASRRGRLALVLVLVAGLVAAAVGWFGADRSSRRGSLPTPRPTRVVAQPFLGAPPLCDLAGGRHDPAHLADRFLPLVGTGPCPSGPRAGRYLSLSSGFNPTRTYAFTVPAHWEVLGMDAMNGEPGSPGGNGLVARSVVTGDGFAFTSGPIDESRYALGAEPRDWGPERLARWAATRSDLVASPVRRVTFAGVPAWQVDLTVRAGAHLAGHCLVVARCVPVFEVSTATSGAHQAAIGVGPGGQSRALLLHPEDGGNALPVLVWVWGRYRTDDVTDPSSEVRQVVDSLVLNPTAS